MIHDNIFFSVTHLTKPAQHMPSIVSIGRLAAACGHWFWSYVINVSIILFKKKYNSRIRLNRIYTLTTNKIWQFIIVFCMYMIHNSQIFTTCRHCLHGRTEIGWQLRIENRTNHIKHLFITWCSLRPPE